MSIAILIGVLVVAAILFALDIVPADVVALGALLLLVIAGVIAPDQAFRGFGSETVMMIFGLLVLSAALQRTGVVDTIGKLVLRLSGRHPGRLAALILIAAALTSSLMSNTAATAFLLPIVAGIAHRARVAPSRLLMPLAFGSILSSSVTLISTSTNLVVSGVMARHGLRPITMFELAPIGIPICLAGIVYMLVIGMKLIPAREGPADTTDPFGLRPYLVEIAISPGSLVAGRTLAASGIGRRLSATVLSIWRDGAAVAAAADLALREGDRLLLEGERGPITEGAGALGLAVAPALSCEWPLPGAGPLKLREAVVLTGSPLAGRTLAGHRFRERHGLQVLTIGRHGRTIRGNLAHLPLRAGDVLLVQGSDADFAALEGERLVSLAEDGTRIPHRAGRGAVALGAYAVALGLAATQLVPVGIAVLAGAFVTVVTRCITAEEAYRDIDWKVIILVGCMLAVGDAMHDTGAASLLAGLLLRIGSGAGPTVFLIIFFALAVLITQPMSNQAAAAVLVPVAIETALRLGADPRPFALTIAVAASCSYLTPLEPSCLMVYGPGRYRFSDFLRVGGPLTILIAVLSVILIPLVFPFAEGR